MSDLININGKVPSFLAKNSKAANPFAAAVTSTGFPVISTKGKVFHVIRGDDRQLITKDGEEPASALEVIIVGINPNRSKTYYEETYSEGNSDNKPTCYSLKGDRPEEDAVEPQAKSCAVCPKNQWGSRISDNGSKGKACSDRMRLAVVPAGQINDPMLLSVAPTSLAALHRFGDELAKRGYAPENVVTKLSFDFSAAYPSLTFKAIRFVDEEEFEQVNAVQEQEKETIGQITGLIASDKSQNVEHLAEAPVATAPKRSPKLQEVVEEVSAAPTVSVRVEDDDEEAPVKPRSKAKVKAVDDYDSIDDALDDLDFDD